MVKKHFKIKRGQKVEKELKKGLTLGGINVFF